MKKIKNKIMKAYDQRKGDGSIELVTEGLGLYIKEIQTLKSHTIRVQRAPIKDMSLQRGYLNNFWGNSIIKDKFQPLKWNLQEFYVDIQTRLIFDTHFISWTYACDEKGNVKKLVIESVHHPGSNVIEAYDLCIETEETYLYEYRLYDIDMMIFFL